MGERPQRSDAPRPDPAAGNAGWGPSISLLGVALGLVIGALAWWWTAGQAPAPVAGVAAPAPPVATAPLTAPAAAGVVIAQATPAAAATPPAGEPRIWRQREPDADPTPDLADYVNQGETPTMAEVIDRLHLAGVRTGLGAFSPPGSRPPLVGLAVPEDYALPAGYVRHHQATDDGQRIQPILMFAPDFQLVDATGQPVAMPQDRVVPPELAPAGLPLRRIVVPAPADSSRARN